MFLSAQFVCAKGIFFALVPIGIECKSLGSYVHEAESASLACVESLRFCRLRWKKTPFWGLFPSGPKKIKKLTGALGCMHKAPKCIQSLWDHPKKIPFVQKYKESAICAILREKTPFWGIPRGSKRCSYLRNLSAQGCALAQ